MLKKLSQDIAIYGIADFFFRFTAFAVFPIYAHHFSVAEFGIYALILAAVGIVALFANVGLNNATQRFYWDPETTPEGRPRIVSTGLGLLTAWSSALVLLLILAVYPAKDSIAERYGISWTIALIALVTVIPEQILQYCLDVLRLHFARWRFVLVSFCKNILGVATGLVLILAFGQGLEGLFLGALIGAAFAVPIALYLIRRDLALNFQSDIAGRLLSYGYPFIFAGMAYWIFGSVDRWMLAELSAPEQVGFYAIAYKFAAVVLFINGAFGQAWSPFALKLRIEDPGYRAGYARVLSVWFFFLILTGSAVALFGPELLRILTPAEYWAAAPVLGALIMGVVLSGTTQITAVGISLEKRTRLFAAAAWTTAVVNVLLNFVLIPRWGAFGAAVATLISYALLTSLYLFWSQRLHPIPLEKQNLAYSATLVVGILLASILLGDLAPSLAAGGVKVALLSLIVGGGAFLGIVNLSALKRLVLPGAMRR